MLSWIHLGIVIKDQGEWPTPPGDLGTGHGGGKIWRGKRAQSGLPSKAAIFASETDLCTLGITINPRRIAGYQI